jgi:hypothetical protein
MGDNHDLSGYTRQDMCVEFTDLAKEGRQTPYPYWMQQEKIPQWAAEKKSRWEERARPAREEMLKALKPSSAAAKKEEAAAAK